MTMWYDIITCNRLKDDGSKCSFKYNAVRFAYCPCCVGEVQAEVRPISLPKPQLLLTYQPKKLA